MASNSTDRLLVRIEGDFSGLRGALNGAQKAVVTNTKQINTALVASNQNFRRLGPVAQQAGFQIGDFAVQVASGQGALRAFIQQGTQLLGFFGPWGAVIGAAGAIVGALAMSLLSAGDEADDAADKTDRFAEANKKLADAIDDTRLAIISSGSALDGYLLKLQMVRQEDITTRLNEEGAKVRALREELALQEEIAKAAADPKLGGIETFLDTDEMKSLRQQIEQGQFIVDELAKMAVQVSEPVVGEDFNKPEKEKGTPEKKKKAIEEQTSALGELIGQQQIDLRLIRLTARERAIEEAIIRATAAAMEDEKAGLRDTALLRADEAAGIRAKAAALYDAQQALKEEAEAEREAERAAADHKRETEKLTREFTDLAQGALRAGDSIEAWADVLLDKIDAISDAIISMLNIDTGGESGLAGIFTSIIGAVAGGVGGIGSGSVVGGPGFGTPREGGGPVRKGVGYAIGPKQNQEIFVPGESGMIFNRSQARGGRDGNRPQFFINMPGATLEAVLRLEGIIRAVNGSIEERAVNAMVNQRYRGGANAQPFR